MADDKLRPRKNPPGPPPSDAEVIEQRIPVLIDKWGRGETSLREIYGYSDEELFGISQQGYTLLMEGKLEAAKCLFEGLVALDPKNDYYYRALGVLYHRLGDPERAVRQFGYAIRVQPSDLISHVNRAEIFVQQKNFAAAFEDLQQVVHIGRPDQAMVRKANAMLRMLPHTRRKTGTL